MCNMYRARIFVFKQLESSIILSGPAFFPSVLRQSFLAATYFGKLLDQITLYISLKFALP